MARDRSSGRRERGEIFWKLFNIYSVSEEKEERKVGKSREEKFLLLEEYLMACSNVTVR